MPVPFGFDANANADVSNYWHDDDANFINDHDDADDN